MAGPGAWEPVSALAVVVAKSEEITQEQMRSKSLTSRRQEVRMGLCPRDHRMAPHPEPLTETWPRGEPCAVTTVQ
jgi:hypothetical protein